MSEHKHDGVGPGAVLAVLMILALIGVTVVGGGAAVFYFRSQNARQQAELVQAQAEAEMLAAQMQAQAAAAQQPAPAPEILVEISAAGDYKLAGKKMEYYDDLKAGLLEAYFERGKELQVVISADKETRFDRVTKAVEAAECAGIVRHRILAPTSQPPSLPVSAEATASQP